MLGAVALSDRFAAVQQSGRALVEHKVEAYIGIT